MATIKASFCYKSSKQANGFTMMEMVLVIIILGIMAVGISGFISLSTQSYVNATNRDELVGNARFVIERLSRELRDVVPNSVRIASFTSALGPQHCLQFTPIVASSVYTDIPVLPEPARTTISVIPFDDYRGDDYVCDSDAGCNDLITIYPLDESDIYSNHLDVVGKIFPIEQVDRTVEPWEISILNSQEISFTEDSPTQRLYVTRNQVSYCTIPKATGVFMVRFEESITAGDQSMPDSGEMYMSGYLNTYMNKPPFEYEPATLKRNAVVQIYLPFTKGGENYVFDHEVHINNVP